MLSNIAIGYIIAGILAVIGGGVKLYLAYRYGRKTQEGIYKDAMLKATLDMHKAASDVAVNTPRDDIDILSRL